MTIAFQLFPLLLPGQGEIKAREELDGARCSRQAPIRMQAKIVCPHWIVEFLLQCCNSTQLGTIAQFQFSSERRQFFDINQIWTMFRRAKAVKSLKLSCNVVILFYCMRRLLN